MLALIYTCGIMTILFLESFYRSRESLRYDTYGEWTGAVFGAEEGARQILEESEATKRIGKIVMLGTSWQNGERLGEAGYVDRTAAALSRIQMTEGYLPSDRAEVALSETAASRLPKQVSEKACSSGNSDGVYAGIYRVCYDDLSCVQSGGCVDGSAVADTHYF